MSFKHMHDGMPCQQDGCALPSDPPTMTTVEEMNQGEMHQALERLQSRMYTETVSEGYTSAPITLGFDGAMGGGILRYPDDRVLPIRFVTNSTTGELTIRCMGLLGAGRGCSREWQVMPHGSENGSWTIAEALGHCAVDHGF